MAGDAIPPPGPDLTSSSDPTAPDPPESAARSPSTNGSPGSQDLDSIARNRARYDFEPDADDKLDFPEIHADPLAGSSIPPEDRDPFLFPWLMNLIDQDRWRLVDDPQTSRDRRLRRQSKIDIRDPDPDTANFPNGAFTLPKGRVYIENSPVGFYGASKTQARVYQWEYLLRYGLTDNLEFRIFSNGLTAQAARGRQPSVTGYSPLAFDLKMHFWEENTRYHIPAMGVEIYLQTAFGSPVFSAGTQPSVSLLFDQTLPFGVGFEYNFGISGIQNGLGQIQYQFSYQWSFQRQVVEDFDVFVHGFYNESGLPRLLQFRSVTAREVQSLITQAKVPVANVVGLGSIWTVSDRLSVFGSYNFGTTTGSPSHIALLGFAVAL